MFARVIKSAITSPRLVLISTRNCSAFTQVTEKDGIREIRLNNEKTKNSLSLQMMNNLISDITRDENNETLRAIVLSSTGNVFSAGHNLKELTKESGPEHHKAVFTRCADLMLAIMNSPVPIIAKVDGLATAAGCQLVATCDIVVCSERSKFSTPGANFGIFCSTPGIALARAVPRMQASYMLLTGLPIDAKEAKNSGLVTDVVPKEELDARVEEICEAIKHKSRSVVELGKKFFYAQLNFDVKTAYDLGAQTMVSNLKMKDGAEGIQSFVEKRKPKWSHKN
ncbi:enoyl-CoA hydratase domain-containing protein 3, mitochondrial [Culicoides brevitarsis]|uniref:enoyl-CoA hydratase domain-containing protein 3, mitochondrial n=1 Tax=Culicoides brevitarsis TaxID=469753 RepID=UPI00307B8FB7